MSIEESWRALAKDYENARAKPDSLDRLVEWDAQQKLIGPIEGRDILDVGCGNGGKAIELALGGARSVIGIDVAGEFLTPPEGTDVTLAQGDLSELGDLRVAKGKQFDIAMFLQSLSYATDQVATLRATRSLLRPDGVLVVARAHPLRFAVERAERDGVEIGAAYHAGGSFSYRSKWNDEIELTHSTETFGAMVNNLAAAGFWVEEIAEPQLTDEQQRRYPTKQEWMARYAGIVVFRARPRSDH
ncbi:methyltransferase family protein [Kribbella amoyensis]|uniref:Methyltransferase family protein n=1 Tax=Kribbella amoyensis TaxID=996641 RepID=A0A561BQ72_9ACTN|nr:class I SAM-dependent methyltransferase [Kribbella amoyensis]TWD81039.1 methyltransferase family protein [Kribbella amoyensis]